MLKIKKEESYILTKNSEFADEIKLPFSNLNSIQEEKESPLNSPRKKPNETLDKPNVLVFGDGSQENYEASSPRSSHKFFSKASLKEEEIQKQIFDFLIGLPKFKTSKNVGEKPSGKINYLNEKNLYLGDLVIVFPNPDAFQSQYKTIDLGKTLKMFIKSFETDFSLLNKNKNEAFFEAFFQAFEKLNSNITANSNLSPEIKPRAITKIKKPTQNQTDELVVSNLFRSINEKKDNRKKDEVLIESIKDSPLPPMETSKSKKMFLMSENEKLIASGSPRSPTKKSALLRSSQGFVKAKSSKRELKKEFIKSILNKDVSGVSKICTHGGFLQKAPTNKWKQNSQQISDFFSLIRNCILFKVSNEAGFKTRSFLDSSGEYIFTVLYSCDENLKITAELDNFNKQVSLAKTDLLSLEPVDRKLRPIRLNIKLRENQSSADEAAGNEGSNYFLFVKPLILKLLKEINYKRICRDLEISGGQENIEIFEDAIISDEVWKAYYEYLLFLKEEIVKLRNQFRNPEKTDSETRKALAFKRSTNSKHEKPIPLSKVIKHNRRKKLARAYQNLFLLALDIVNSQYKGKKKILLNIWDYSKMQYQEPFFDYFQTPNYMSFRVQNKINTLWKNYQVTETGYHSLFSPIERLKLAYNTLQKVINVPYLIDNQYINDIFTLNDMLTLSGITLKALLGVNVSPYDITKRTETDKRIKFLSTMKKWETKQKQNDTVETEEDKCTEINRLKFDNLLLEWKFKFTNPIYVPVDKIRNYYGEKIALYFQFLAHYTKYLSLMAILGLLKTVLYYIFYENLALRFFMDIFICISLGVWSNAFVLRWGRKELLFAIKYGQLDFEQDERERPLFHGTYKRSLVSDHMNVVSYSRKKKFTKILVAFFISIIMIIVNMIFVSLFFEFVMILYNGQFFVKLDLFRLDIAVPAFMNNMLNQFFNEIFTKFAIKYTRFENHRTLSLFEMSYITKKFLFSLIITVTPLIFISFFNEYNVFEFECPGNCSLQLQVYLRTYYFFSLFTNFWEILKPKITIAYKNFSELKKNKGADKMITKANSGHLTSFIGNRQREEEKKLLFSKANYYIEQEFKKNNYSDSQDIYGTVEDYMEICLNYALLSLCGIGDPLVFFIAFLSMVLEMQTDKHKLIKYTKRPIPLGERTIGIWLELMSFVSNLSVLTNSGIIVFTVYQFSPSDGVLLFVILMLVSFSINWVLNTIFEDIPGNMLRIMKRHDHIKENIVKGIGSSSVNISEKTPSFPIFKIFNTKIAIEGKDEFEDVNSFDYTKDDKGDPKGEEELKKKKLLKDYRKEFREIVFKDFRWNPNMIVKTPSIIRQELAYRKKKREPKFINKLKNIKKIYDLNPKENFKNWDEEHFSNFGGKLKKESAGSINVSDTLFSQKKTKQQKREEMHKYLELKKNKSELNNLESKLFVDLGFNSNQYLLPNDIEFCLSDYSRKMIDSKRFCMLLIPPFQFHEIEFFEKSIRKFIRAYSKEIHLIKRISSSNNEEIWLGICKHQKKKVGIKIAEVNENFKFSDEFIEKKKKTLNILEENPIDLSNNNKFSCISKRLLYYYEVESFEYLSEDDNTHYYLIEIFEIAELVDNNSFIEYSLKTILEKRKENNNFYNDLEILFYAELFLFLMDSLSKSDEFRVYETIKIDDIYLKLKSPMEIKYFISDKKFEKMSQEDQKKINVFRINEYKNWGQTLLNMICLFKLKIDWEDNNAIDIVLDTITVEYPKSIVIIKKLLKSNPEEVNFPDLSQEISNILSKEQKNSPKEYMYFVKSKKNSDEKHFPLNFIHTYMLMGNHFKTLDLIKNLPAEKMEEKIKFYELLANYERDDNTFEDFEKSALLFVDYLREKYGIYDRREIKPFYFLASKSHLLKIFDKSISYLLELWQILQINCLEENMASFEKFYELQGKLLRDTNKFGDSLKSFEKLLNLPSLKERIHRQAEILMLIARVKNELNQPLELVNYLNDALKLIKKTNNPNIFVIYGLIGYYFMQLGKTVQGMFNVRKSYKWLFKNDFITFDCMAVKTDEFFWLFPDFFKIIPNDISKQLLLRYTEKITLKKNVPIVNGIQKLILSRIYWLYDKAKSWEFLDVSEQKFKETFEKNDNSEFNLNKQLYVDKYLSFVYEMKSLLTLYFEEENKTKKSEQYYKEMIKYNSFEKVSNPNLEMITVINRSFILYLSGKISEGIQEIWDFLERKKKIELQTLPKIILCDFLGFMLAFKEQEGFQDFWIQMIEISSYNDQFMLNTYLRLCTSLIVLKLYEKALGFLEFMTKFIDSKNTNENDNQIIIFDIKILVAVCNFHQGNYSEAKNILEQTLEYMNNYSQKKKGNFVEKKEIEEFFRKFFKNKMRKSILLSNLGKIHGFLGYNDHAYFIFNKSFKILKKDLTHIKYTLKKNNSSKIKEKKVQSAVLNELNKSDPNISKILESVIENTTSRKETEIFNICLQSANPILLISNMVNISRIQMQSLKYSLALKFLRILEVVVEKLESQKYLAVYDIQYDDNLFLIQNFIHFLLIKNLFVLGFYDNCIAKFLEFKSKMENMRNENQNFQKKLSFYLFQEISGWANFNFYRNIENSFQNYHYCWLENTKIFGQNDSSTLDISENFLIILNRKGKLHQKTDKFFQEDNMLLLKIQENLINLKEKYISVPNYVSIANKSLGVIEMTQKNYFKAYKYFEESKKMAEKSYLASYLIGYILLDMGKKFYKESKLLEAENLGNDALKHFKYFLEKNVSGWEICKSFYFLGKISMKFSRMIEENIKILEELEEKEMGKWEKHFVEIKLWEENKHILTIFEEYRENSFSLFLIRKLKATYNEAIVNEFIFKQSYKNKKRYNMAVNYFEEALIILKGQMSTECEYYKKIEDKLIHLKYYNQASSIV